MKKTFVLVILVLILASFALAQQKDTGQVVKQAATYESQAKASTDMGGKENDKTYEKTLSLANLSIVVAMTVLAFVALLAVVVGAYGIAKTRRIDREVREQFDKVEKSKEKMETAVETCVDKMEQKMERLETIGERVEKLKDEVEEHIKHVRIGRKTFEESVNKFKEDHLIKPEEVPEDFSKKVAELPEKDPKTAIEVYEKLQDKIFGSDIYWVMAFNYYKLEQFEKSADEFEKYVRIVPDNPKAYYNWGVILAMLAHERKDETLYYESFKKYELAVKYKDDFHQAYYNWGTAIALLADLKKDASLYLESFKKFALAVKYKRDKYEAYGNWGSALVKLGKLTKEKRFYEEALSKFEKVIEIKQDESLGWYNKAWALSLLEEKEKVLESLKRAIELDSKYKEEAKEDEDFEWLWDDPDFKKLVE